MAAINWGKIRGIEFTLEEAREVSDFEEVLRNFGVDADRGWELFGEHRNLSVAKRLFFAEKMSLDSVVSLLFSDTDHRIVSIIKQRLAENRKEDSGGIIMR